MINLYALRFTDRIFYENHDFGAIILSLAGGLIHPNFAEAQSTGKERDPLCQAMARMPSNLEPLKLHLKTTTLRI